MPTTLLADGGTLRRSVERGDLRISVFTSPAVPRVGPIDVGVLVQDVRTDEIRHDVKVGVRLQCLDAAAIPLHESATRAAATNRLFKAALFDVPTAGTWRVTVSLPEVDEAEPIAFELPIAEPPPAWRQLAPWVGWPLVVVALFVVHQRAMDRRQSK